MGARSGVHVIHRVHIAAALGLGLCLGLAGCAFQPGGAAGEIDGNGGDDDDQADGTSADAPVVTDGRPVDAPIAVIDAPVDAMVPEGGLVRVATLTAAGALDGVADELGGSMRYPLDLATPGHRDFVTGYQPSMRAELRAGQDATYLYLFVEVFEAEPHSGDSMSTWQNDAVTFYLDTNNDRAGAYGNDDHEIIIDYRPTYGIYPTTNGVVDPTIEAVRLNTADGFTIEARMLKSGLGSLLGGRVGFGWGIYDDDGGGNAEAYGLWYERPAPRCATCCTGEAHAEAWCDTTMLGQLAFSP
jgi:hypothetical protein